MLMNLAEKLFLTISGPACFRSTGVKPPVPWRFITDEQETSCPVRQFQEKFATRVLS